MHCLRKGELNDPDPFNEGFNGKTLPS